MHPRKMHVGLRAVLWDACEGRQLRTGRPWPVRRLVTEDTATTGKAYHRRMGPEAASHVPAGSPSCSPLKTLHARAALDSRAPCDICESCGGVQLLPSCRLSHAHAVLHSCTLQPG